MSKENIEEKDKKIKETTPIFNINIEIIGWNRPFHNISQLLQIAEKLKQYKDYQGNSVVCLNGLLSKGYDDELYDFRYTVNLKKEIGDEEAFVFKDNQAYLNFVETRYRFKNPMTPFYRLEALYRKLKDNNLESKIKALMGIFSQNLGEEIDTGLEDRYGLLKQLEERYLNTFSKAVEIK